MSKTFQLLKRLLGFSASDPLLGSKNTYVCHDSRIEKQDVYLK